MRDTILSFLTAHGKSIGNRYARSGQTQDAESTDMELRGCGNNSYGHGAHHRYSSEKESPVRRDRVGLPRQRFGVHAETLSSQGCYVIRNLWVPPTVLTNWDDSLRSSSWIWEAEFAFKEPPSMVRNRKVELRLARNLLSFVDRPIT